ncbi:WXG100 family type VII secretion target [Nocardia cyriacigeorgica]|uniref:ESAT-6-like protein n=1 Tax=Nocardia cyriacigeorgica TaxID=135487 RepID=A0A6P1DBI0_9NOCA|nr:WXG100 family type VII secretion target [Nocardia cyriacigeorgica]NEW48115.1 WXG100 family type VII secretion target [Nocardia cyriacigeorgica]NEW52728.1 WXG100 family type VII secretion target [Nocardia cyriacigeorgica]NEW57344.1 WXG100 family type VII secretion target [Nocardia cyriacigeorgica]
MNYSKEQLIELANQIRASERRLQETQEELKGYVNGLVAEWDGAARESYQTVQAEWDTAQQTIMTTLETIAKVVEDGAISMDEMDMMNSRSWA